MVGSGRNILPDWAISHSSPRGAAPTDWREALESIRDIAESRAPGALGQILAISMDALRQGRS